ncbi:MAG: hypothetical protein KDC92_18170, partial [Bacteroidetes bacterium]|nr:hypothetical protein [Bacteroidota bacterium]
MVFTSVENEIAVAEDDSKYEFSFGFTNGFDGRTSLKFDYTSINYKGVLNFYAYRQVCSNGMMGWKKLEDLKNLREGEEFKTKWEREILKRKIERFSFRHNMNNLIGRVEIAFKEAMRNNEMTADFLSLIYKQTYQKELVDKFLEKIRKGDQEVVGDILIASNNMHEFINHITAMESHIPQFKD